MTVSWESPIRTRALRTSPRLRARRFWSPVRGLLTPEEVKTAHALGLQVAPYTANTEAEWKRLADAHVDAIITDDPAGLLAWLRAQTPVLHR